MSGQVQASDPTSAIIKGIVVIEVLIVIAAAVVAYALAPKNPYEDTFAYQQNPLVDSVEECRQFEQTVGATGPGGTCAWLAWEDSHANDGQGAFWIAFVGLNILTFVAIGLYVANARSAAPGVASAGASTRGTVVCFSCQSVVPKARRCRKCGADLGEA